MEQRRYELERFFSGRNDVGTHMAHAAKGRRHGSNGAHKSDAARLRDDHELIVTQNQSVVPQLDIESYRDICKGLGRIRAGYENKVEALAKQLPVYEWVEKTKGAGALGLGKIVGNAGNLSDYSNPAKLWKRFGLAPGQRRSTNKEEAIAMGFNPFRRALMHSVGAALIKTGVDYKAIYDKRKLYETEQHPDLSKIHLHKRAMRYMEKRFLLDLWKHWRLTATRRF